jgi:hypothetical protein
MCLKGGVDGAGDGLGRKFPWLFSSCLYFLICTMQTPYSLLNSEMQDEESQGDRSGAVCPSLPHGA